MFWAEIWKVSEVFIWKFSIFGGEFSTYLQRRVFVMNMRKKNLPELWPLCFFPEILLVDHRLFLILIYWATYNWNYLSEYAHQHLYMPYSIRNPRRKTSIIYSRLSLSRIPRNSLKYFEISVLRYIKFAELRKKLIRLTTLNKYMCNWTLEVRDILKTLWKRGGIAPQQQFLLFSTIFLHIFRFSCLGREYIFTSR